MVASYQFVWLWCLCLLTAAQECEPPRAPSLLQSRQSVDLKPDPVEEQLATMTGMMRQMQAELSEMEGKMGTDAGRVSGWDVPQGDGRVAALLAKLQNQSSELNPSCRRLQAQPHLLTEKPQVQLASAEVRAGCAANFMELHDFGATATATSCCPKSDLACAGCASFAQTCQECQGGFVKRQGVCIACTSSSEWLNENGLSCTQLALADCNDLPVRGESSNQACCECGGGHVIPTPFEYPSRRWALTSEIHLRPEPRTAERYTVDSGCELAAYNLTISGSSGLISYIDGKKKPDEAFSIQCEVTAHQQAGVSFTAVVKVTADVLTYQSSALLFHTGSTESPLTSVALSKFALSCAPELDWLVLDGGTGVLRFAPGSAAGAGGVSVVEEKFFGQDGGVCTVSAWAQGEKYQASFMALKPRPWPNLQYDLSSVSVSLGQELLPLKPKTPAAQGLMKPFAFHVACDVSGAAKAFTFDRLLGVGFLDGHSVLELDKDGQLTIAPASTLVSLFDQLLQDAQRKHMTLQCRVVGLFPDQELPPVETSLSIHIQDSVCWVSETVQGVAVPDADGAADESKCRMSCRLDDTCANYKYESNSCLRYDVRQDGVQATVTAKITNCTNEGTCMRVQHSLWYLSGKYCPIGRDAVKGGIMYIREHETAEDMVYLYQSREGDGCSLGEWLLQGPGDSDYVAKSSGLFEFRGKLLECLPDNQVSFALSACSTSSLAWEEEEDGEGLAALVLDNPGTADLADHWLHPCDCAPPAWNTEEPVNKESFEELPAGNQNNFLPSPFVIVTGQFVCPSRQLLPDVGVRFQTEEELQEPSDCEARCRDHSRCGFFWHGAQHGAATCRLFSGCDSLVREFSLEGQLLALVRESKCMVADADACWATSLRRSFLSMAFDPTGARVAEPVQTNNAPPKPADPPAQGMVSWFKSENAGSVWPSSVGGFEGTANRKSVFREVAAGYGADRAVTYIRGATDEGFNFGAVLPPTFTLCSVTRYTGGNRKRILQSGDSNMIHGHWENEVGVACYVKWITYSEHNKVAGVDVAKKDKMDWLVLCGTNVAQRVYDGTTNVATGIAGPRPSTETLMANAGKYAEFSDWAVMEVMTWDRALSDAEMLSSVEYLQWKLRAGSSLELSEHLATWSDSNFESFGHQSLDGVVDQTFHVGLANGYKVSLVGWPYTRSYAFGFLRNMDGKATATVTDLVPSAQYIFQVYMRSTASTYMSVSKVSVNHGSESTAFQDGTDFACVSGVAIATPRGEINFEFDRAGSHHVHLSGLAIARVSSPFVMLQSGASGSSSVKQSDFEAGFGFLHLYQQCDAALLLGGVGVQSCGRPTYRATDSHAWKHKKPLPSSLSHGSTLLASCWSERFRLTRAGATVGLQGLSCDACVQVAARGYASYHQRNEQELYHFNRMALSVYTELGMIKELSVAPKHSYCLDVASDANVGNMTVTASTGCSANLLAQVSSLSNPQHRQLRLIPSNLSFAEHGQCLTAKEAEAGLEFRSCNKTDDKQLMSPASLPSDMWSLHVEAEERTQDLHKPYSSYCGTSGALSNLDFGQIFVGDTETATKCKFAPLIAFGDFVDTGIIRDKTSSNWIDWHHLLADYPVQCGAGEALTAFKLDSGRNSFTYECSKIGGLGACFDAWSSQAEVLQFGPAQSYWAKPMRMMHTDCGGNAVLGGFHFEFSEGGRWARVRYSCCKAGGAPIVIDPRGQVPDLMSPFDGVFCPKSRDPSGRLEYESSGRSLTFDRSLGKWCIGSECSHVTASATPLDAPLLSFDVVNVTDFNGEFLGGGVPGEGGKKTLSLEQALKLRPPKRPVPPPMPELEEFKAEQPKYAAECLDYKDLWKEVTETFTNEEDETVTETSALEADPGTKGAELRDYHPCEVAKNAGGVFGNFGGGDGSMAPENMMYSDWNDCMQGDIERDLLSAQGDYKGALSEFVQDITQESLGVVCSIVPDTMIAPFGVGVAINPGEICGQAADLVGAIKTFAGPASSYHFAKKEWDIQREGYAACNPLQIGFARAFCDIHCVRDAVIRGDRSIIRNLEAATKKTNTNLQNMVKWSVDTARGETGWLADKLDYMHAINTAYLQQIHDFLAPSLDQQKALKGMRMATDSMFEELSGYASASSFDEVSRLTVHDALQSFLRAKDPSNATEGRGFLRKLSDLHQILARSGKSRSAVLGRQMNRQVRHLQKMAQQQLNVLGVYRMESNASRAHRSLEGNTLVALDRIWWQLRMKLEKYLDTAEAEVKAFQKSIDDMDSYEGCQAGFSSLVSSYTHSMAVMRRSHRLLRSTWREAAGLVGELASVLVDSGAFDTFVRNHGCSSSVMEDTLKQVRSAYFGLALLLHRFRAAGLAQPHMDQVHTAARRINEAHAAAVAHCDA
ncbi:unnamed protein product [Effrenium voratum]|nr:unnamed protein product [Effrenium voratum]